MDQERKNRIAIFRKTVKNMQKNIKEGSLLCGRERVAFVYSLEEVETSINELLSSFPKDICRHYFALKALPIPKMLEIYKKHGFGQECASFGEVIQALRCGFKPEDIIYDSPCKTEYMLEECIKKDVFLINMDNFQEWDRVRNIISKYPESKTKFGLRINPQLGKGKLAETSTATSSSKFGVPVKEVGVDALIKQIESFPRFMALHMHIGSGEFSFRFLVDGVKYLVSLAEKVNQTLGRKQIEVIDIGGGFPIAQLNHKVAENVGKDSSSMMEEEEYSQILFFKQYWTQIEKEVPEIRNYRICTEFGRACIHRAGFGISRVEYTKRAGRHQKAIQHLGAEAYVWCCYSHERMFGMNPIYLNEDATLKDLEQEAKEYEKMKQQDKEEYPLVLDVVGGLCFSGDNVCSNRKVLPSLKQNDIIIFPSSGAYNLSNWAKFNSFQMPACYLIDKDGKMECVKKAEEIEESLKIWGKLVV